MHGHDLGLSVAENYRAFAEDARGRSPVYQSLAGSVAGDAAILRFLGSLPREKRQPNLLFAAARYLLDGPVDLDRLRSLVSLDGAELAEVMLARRTQTNEPARCATLLPALAQLPQPLALIEAGASAGLTLLVVTSDDDVRWLSCLVWPGEGDREQRLAAAVAAARRDPPVVHRGDLLTDLPALAAQAPADATLVVYHSAVLYQVPA